MSMGTAIIGVVMHLGAYAGFDDAIDRIIIPAGMTDEEVKIIAKEFYEKLGNVDASALPGGDAEMYRQINELIIQDGMSIVVAVCAALFLIGALLTLAINIEKNTGESK